MNAALVDTFDNPLRHFLCGMFVKNTKGVYTWVSDGLLKLQKLSSQEILGKTDRDLPWSGYQNQLRLHDQEILDRKVSVTFPETIHRQGCDIDGFCHKSLVFDVNGHIRGAAGIFFDTPRSKDPLVSKLSFREKQCLKNLTKGMSSKESAINLRISPRTVEGYLEQLRGKFYCKNQAELLSFYYENRAGDL